MPRPVLSEEQLARNRAGFCACGCGRPLPRRKTWDEQDAGPSPSAVWGGRACRRRAHYLRTKAGLVESQDYLRQQMARLVDEKDAAQENAERSEKEARRFRGIVRDLEERIGVLNGKLRK